jgi:hypothetical protein
MIRLKITIKKYFDRAVLKMRDTIKIFTNCIFLLNLWKPVEQRSNCLIATCFEV